MATDVDGTGDIREHPDVRAVIQQMLDALTGPDAGRRREVASWVGREAVPELRARVVGLLADRLGSACPKEPRRAAKALLAVGPAALLSLLPRLLATADPAARDRLVAVVAGIGGALPVPGRVGLIGNLGIALGVAGDWDAARAVARVMVRLREEGPPPDTENPGQVELVMAIGAVRLTGGWQKLVGAEVAVGDPAPAGSSPHEPPAEKRRCRPGRGARRRAGPAGVGDG
ncbi:MAG TPA: hypothetical protein VM597_21185 [Gemmataceae bacterium]|nr:hypothetical protein [Gemmataceae bacterium]